MGHEFTVEEQVEVPCSPSEVWDAIATGPGLDAWFLGRNDVVPGLGGAVRSDFAGGAIPPFAVTEWEPGRRLQTSSPTLADGRFQANEHLIEGRAGGSSVVRIVTSGFLPGDDWESEFEAMRAGGCVFRSSLVEYLTHFRGQAATPVTVFGPPIQDWPRAWTTLDDALGLKSLNRGEAVSLEVPGLPVIVGVLYSSNELSRSIRTRNGLYRFIQGFRGPMVLCHITFTAPGDRPPGPPETSAHETAWQAWADATWS